jgi:hypothetical protein
MTKKENLLIIFSEECTEIIQDMENGFNIENEINDFFAVYEMLIEFDYIVKDNSIKVDTAILSNKLLKLEFLKLQYFISKALRFGLTHNHPKTGRTNMLEILTCFQKIYNSTKEFYDNTKIENKKIKVDKFSAVSVEMGTLIL